MVARRVLLAAGWLWPFVVACGGVAVVTAGHSLRNDEAFVLLFALALLGAPAVVVTTAEWLPRGWSAELRQAVGLLVAVPVLLAEVVLASWVLEAGARAVGSAWIE